MSKKLKLSDIKSMLKMQKKKKKAPVKPNKSTGLMVVDDDYDSEDDDSDFDSNDAKSDGSDSDNGSSSDNQEKGGKSDDDEDNQDSSAEPKSSTKNNDSSSSQKESSPNPASSSSGKAKSSNDDDSDKDSDAKSSKSNNSDDNDSDQQVPASDSDNNVSSESESDKRPPPPNLIIHYRIDGEKYTQLRQKPGKNAPKYEDDPTIVEIRESRNAERNSSIVDGPSSSSTVNQQQVNNYNIKKKKKNILKIDDGSDSDSDQGDDNNDNDNPNSTYVEPPEERRLRTQTHCPPNPNKAIGEEGIPNAILNQADIITVIERAQDPESSEWVKVRKTQTSNNNIIEGWISMSCIFARTRLLLAAADLEGTSISEGDEVLVLDVNLKEKEVMIADVKQGGVAWVASNLIDEKGDDFSSDGSAANTDSDSDSGSGGSDSDQEDSDEDSESDNQRGRKRKKQGKSKKRGGRTSKRSTKQGQANSGYVSDSSEERKKRLQSRGQIDLQTGVRKARRFKVKKEIIEQKKQEQLSLFDASIYRNMARNQNKEESSDDDDDEIATKTLLQQKGLKTYGTNLLGSTLNDPRNADYNNVLLQAKQHSENQFLNEQQLRKKQLQERTKQKKLEKDQMVKAKKAAKNASKGPSSAGLVAQALAAARESQENANKNQTHNQKPQKPFVPVFQWNNGHSSSSNYNSNNSKNGPGSLIQLATTGQLDMDKYNQNQMNKQNQNQMMMKGKEKDGKGKESNSKGKDIDFKGKGNLNFNKDNLNDKGNGVYSNGPNGKDKSNYGKDSNYGNGTGKDLYKGSSSKDINLKGKNSAVAPPIAPTAKVQEKDLSSILVNAPVKKKRRPTIEDDHVTPTVDGDDAGGLFSD